MNKVYKTILSIAACSIVAGATIAPSAVNAWGDSNKGRESYTIAQINAGVLGDKITFNSISDGKIGDEKNFVGAKLSTDTGTVWSANEIHVAMGETYTVRIYVHNNSPKGTAKIAENVTASFSLPTTVGTEQTIVGYIDSSNATPARYWDEVKLVADQDFFIEYVEGSAKYTNAKMGTVALPNEVITSGAKLGYDKLDGKIPGCYEYDGVVTIEVKVHALVASKVSKTVRNVTPSTTTKTGFTANGNKFGETVDAKVGDYVEYQIEYRNLLGERVENVMIRDALPTNMEYVANTTRVYNSNYQDGILIKENTVTTDGINIGNYDANGLAYVRFVAKVVDKELGCGDNVLVNWASATVNSKVVKDDAKVNTNKVCETPTTPDKPKPEDPKPTDPGTPKELPNTGATEAAGAALGAGAVTTALGYFIASRKKLM